MLSLIIKWGLFLGIAGLLAWRILALGLANYYADQHDHDPAKALAWYSQHPKALFIQARDRLADDPLSAEHLFAGAAWENPADARIYAALAGLRADQGQVQSAQALAMIADRLAPMRPTVQWAVAAFWLQQGRLDLALAHWTRVLSVRPQFHQQLDSVLLRLLEDPTTRPVVLAFLEDLPAWWSRFFRYAAANAGHPDSVAMLYHVGSRNGRKPSAGERRHYIIRLQKDDLWNQAYFVWLNSLEPEQLQVLGNLYNGNFELPLSDEDFGWRTAGVRGVVIKTGLVVGAEGSRALSVNFRGRRIHFNHLYQYLVLRPGHYQLRGRVRPDNLLAAQGVQWTLRCKPGEREVLGTSERFRGTETWTLFEIPFTVPDKHCSVQELRLQLVARFAKEREARGTVWFDAMRIKRLPSVQ